MKLIILDRDGVINFDSPDYIKSPDEWQPIPGSPEAIARLNKAGYCVTVATNQSGIARGFYDLSTLNAIHHKMRQVIELVGGNIDSIFYCPHGPNEQCNCRKPNPGLLLQISQYYKQDLTGIPVVGDSWRDIEAAQMVGAHPVLVLTGNGKKALEKASMLKDIEVVEDLATYVDQLLAVT